MLFISYSTDKMLSMQGSEKLRKSQRSQRNIKKKASDCIRGVLHLHNLSLHITFLYLSLSARDLFNAWKYEDEQWLFSPLQKSAPQLQWADILHDAMTAREDRVLSLILLCNKEVAKLSTETEEFLSMDDTGLCQHIFDIYSYFCPYLKRFC